MYCPNCGTKNKPNSHFCKNCGYDLAKYKQKQASVNQKPKQNPSTPPKHRAKHFSRRPPLRHRPAIPQPPRPMMQPQMMPPKRHHKGCFVSILIVVVLAALVFGGVYTYSHNLYPFGNGPLSSVSQSSGGGNSHEAINDLWQKVNNKMNSNHSNSDSDDFTSDFDNGSSNSAYHTVDDWTNLVNKSDENNDIKVNEIKPYDFKNSGNNKYTYKVRYDFIVDNGNGDTHHHIQIFDWKSNLKNGKIVSMNSPKKPEQDYQE